MKRIFVLLLFWLSIPILSGQIYTQNIQDTTGGPLELHSLSVDSAGRLYTALYKVDTLVPQPTRWGTALVTRHQPNLDFDFWGPILPDDSLPKLWHGISPLHNGSLLNFFYINGTNGFQYQWSSFAYALLNSQFQTLKKGYDTAQSQMRIMDAWPVGQASALSLVFEPDSSLGSTFIQRWQPASGQVQWRLQDSLTGLRFSRLRFEGVYRYGDSLRVFLKFKRGFGVLGAVGPQDYAKPRKMITLHRATGGLGQVRSLPGELIAITQRQQKGYSLLFLDSASSTLRYQERDSSWQVARNQTIPLDSLLPRYQLKTTPHVLTDQKGIGFIASSSGAGRDSLYFLRVNFQSRLVQKELIRNLPPGLNFSYSLPGPGGTYCAALWNRKDWYLLKAQPRNRIGLPAPEAVSENLQVSPLPASDQLQVKLPAVTGRASHSYRLYGLTGQMYQHGTLAFSGGEATLDLNELPKGSYILVLEAGEKRYRARVVVE